MSSEKIAANPIDLNKVDQPEVIIKEIDEHLHFKSKLYLWLITTVGLSFYGYAGFFLLYGVALLLSPVHRDPYRNLAIASLIATFITIYLARKIIVKFGAEDIHIHKDYFILYNRFGKSRRVDKDDILYIKIEKPNPLLEFLPLTSPSVIIVTYNQIITVKSVKYAQKDQLLKYFEKESVFHTDDFALYFHRAQNSFARFILRFTQDTAGVIGLIIIIVFTFLAVWGAFAMMISSTSSLYTHTLFLRNPEFLSYGLGYTWEESVLRPPDRNFWFGTDFVGRDIFSRLIFGTTFTFLIAITGSFLSITFILIFGLTSAFNEGFWDNFIMRVSDALLSFPPFVFLIIFSAISIPLRAAIPGGFFLAVYAGMSIVTWPAGARIIRSNVKELLESEYILASKQLGASKYMIMKDHILPQIIPTTLVILTYQITDIILGTTLLGYIGFGSESTLIWGSDLSHSLFDLEFVDSWWTMFFPSLFIFLLIFGLTLFSDSIRDNMDPKMQGGKNSLPYEVRKQMEVMD